MMKFLEDLKKELKKQNVSDKDIDEIIKDHEDMIHQALEEGHLESDVILRFGDPVLLAKELSEELGHQDVSHEASETFKLWKSYVPNSDSFSLQVKLVSEDLTIQPSKDDQIHILYQGTSNIEKYEISYSNDLLKIEAPQSRGLFFMKMKNDDMNFIVEIPKALEFVTCSQKGVSSDFILHNLEITNFSINTTSGDCDIQNSTFKDVKWNTVSGDISASNLKISSLIVSMVSGDLTLNQTDIETELTISTVSGDVKVENSLAHTVFINSVSGDIEAKEFYTPSMKFKSVSGNCHIDNKDKSKTIVMSSHTIGGEIRIES